MRAVGAGCIIIKFSMTVIGVMYGKSSVTLKSYAIIILSTMHIIMYLQHPKDVVKQLLSTNVYAKAPNQTLSEDDWSHQKAAIFLKSVFNSTLLLLL